MDEKKINAGLRIAQGIETGSLDSKNLLKIVHTANKFDSSIVLHTPEKVIDVKSFLGLSVSLAENTEYQLEIHGNDEAEAKKAMLESFHNYGIQVVIK
jgi:phosphocarrier protein HPr